MSPRAARKGGASAGLKSVTVDGQSVTYGEEERLAYWEPPEGILDGPPLYIPGWGAEYGEEAGGLTLQRLFCTPSRGMPELLVKIF